jgi:hypothetical protein
MVVAFPGNRFRGEIAPALAELSESGTIRIIDLAFVSKDAEGNVMATELEDNESDVGRAFRTIEAEVGDLINEDDLLAVGEELEPESSAAVLVWEDVWATKLKGALVGAGGVLLDLERVPYQVVDAALAHAGAKERGAR